MTSIRQARVDDVETLQNLNNEVFLDNKKYDDDIIEDWATSNKGRNYFTKLLSDKNSLCLIAENEGKPVGYIACSVKNLDYRKSKNLEINNMGTRPKYRSRGIGTLLIKKAKEWAKQQGYKRMYVNSYFKNVRAIKFYKKSDFKEIDLSLETKI